MILFMGKKHWLICYDISDGRRLYRVEKIVSSYAWRIQKSVFESDAPHETIDVMKKRLEYVIDFDEDSVMIFEIGEYDWKNKICMGKNKIDEIDKISGDKYIIL